MSAPKFVLSISRFYAMGAGLEACTTRGVLKGRGGDLDQGGCAGLHGVPLPASGSGSWELSGEEYSGLGEGMQDICLYFVRVLFWECCLGYGGLVFVAPSRLSNRLILKCSDKL